MTSQGSWNILWLWASVCFTLLSVNVNPSQGTRTEVEASFYGESYILHPLQDDSSTTHVSLEFQTHRPQGLLLLAAGHTDYIIVQLNAGIVETRVNLGSGEAVTFSARGVRLDDSEWHSVIVNRTQDIVYLAVDGADQGQASTPGTYHDLNIDLGVFLGGNVDLKKDVYKNAKPFRGCLRNVLYNERNVLEEVKAMNTYQNVFQVAWHCDDVFTAPSDATINFKHETSFVAFPHLRIYPDASGIFTCELKTRSSDAVILFNSGIGSTWEDFIAVELVDGRPKLSVDKGSGVVEVALELTVNDGKWHTLEVTVSDTTVQLQIDSEKNLTRFHLGSQNYLNLGSNLYIGGVGVKARSHASRLGLASLQGAGAMTGSMLGCVRNVNMNSRNFGFQQIELSRLIDAGCTWDYPCAEEPCVPDAQCTELEGADFRCDCGQPECVKEEFRSKYSEEDNNLNGIVSVAKLVVQMGSSAVIDGNVIRLNRNALRDAIRRQSILFTIKIPPKEGIIEIRGRRGSQSTFTLRNLLSNDVYYRHFGREPQLDSITIEMTFSTFTQQAETTKMNDRYDFVVPVTVLPISGSTLEIALHNGHVLPITSDARVRISTSVVNVKTRNVDPSILTFTVRYLRQSPSMFEYSDKPGRSITTFTLKDVENGKVWFQHRGDDTVYTKINVTDGTLVSAAVDLRFREEQLSISIVNNTGVSVSYGAHSLITSYNLSAVPNVKLENLELKYHITHPPQYGTIQYWEYESREWADAETFTQRQIDRGQIRYLHLPGSAIGNYDTFRFEIMSGNVKTSLLTFKIIFKALTLSVKHNSDLVLRRSLFGKFSDQTLLVETNADQYQEKNMVYMVLRLPQKGLLYLIRRDVNDQSSFDQVPALKVDSTFTQQDVNDGYVYYKLHRPAYDKFSDFTDLQASYFGFTVVVRSVIHYSPEEMSVKFINNGLKDVIEGGTAVITRQDLSLEMEDFKKFTFSIVKYANHGSVNIIDPSTSAVTIQNVSSFTMSQIKEGKVAYFHDDSENKEDSFTFSAAPILSETDKGLQNEIQEYSGIFHMSIKMRNDNPPVRTVNKVFHVASGNVRHITIDDLAFMDPDIDYDDSLLSYQRQAIPNGEILSKVTEEPIYNFTQQDLIDGALIFQHRGASFAQTPLLVTDGQFFTNTLFEIQASPPYVKIANNTGLEVRLGQSVALTSFNLSVETNIDYVQGDLILQLIEEPGVGHLRSGGQQLMKFSYSDLMHRRIKYWQDGGEGHEDEFTFAVLLGSLKTEVSVSVRIITEDDSSPPEIIHNQMLKVRARGTAVISDDLLQVSHKRYHPKEIEFIVTQLPLYGSLVIKGRPAKPGSAPEFTQQDINDGVLSYSSQSATHVTDMFVFDVGTEFQSLRQMEFLIEIIPATPYFTRVNVSCKEGGMVTLNDEFIPWRGRTGGNKRMTYRVHSAPVHGKIMLKTGKTNVQVNTFTSSDAAQSRIMYIHDDSESLHDQFLIRDVDSGQMFDIFVNISAVNDQPPRVTVNTGLDIWTGSLMLLTNKHLQASDPDSSSVDLEFQVTTPTNGHLAYLNNTFKPISKFTQLDLDSGRVVFVHKGSEYGEFKFQVTDGTNKDDLRNFIVRARPVQILVTTNTTLKAFPNTLQPITNNILFAKTSASNFSHPIVFTVAEPRPTKGKLVTLVDQKVMDINSFTQDDVNKGKLFYKHTDYIREWHDSESIYFEITTTYAQPLKQRILNIDISIVNLNEQNYRELLNMNTPTLEEGKKITISRSHFDSSELLQRIQSFRSDVKVVFAFMSSVKHGYLWFKDIDVESGEVFTQEDINSGALQYKHDHSDTTGDAFQFAVKILIPRSVGDSINSVVPVFNFTIDIIPINDQGFELITRHPKIEVTQGSEVVVTAHNLTTVDLDTGPEGIEYIILTQPEIGMLVRHSEPQVRIHSFTQKEINDGLVVFKHDGTRRASGSLYFKVWDKVFDPRYANLDITVFPIYIKVARDRNLPLPQGSKSVIVSNKFLKVSTNGDMNALTYKITQAPQFGKLLKYNAHVTAFTQRDIASGHLMYVQDKDSPGDDFFVCDIDLSNIDCSLDTVQFDIIMRPLIRQGPLITSPGSYVAITRSSLDASELAQITNDNPVFQILKSPLYGRIMRRQRQRRQASMENSFHPVSNFTFEDLLYTKIYYVPNEKDSHASKDKFVYLLTARGVPPAKGEFVIQLDAMDVDDVDEDGEKEGTDSGVETSGSAESDYYPDEKTTDKDEKEEEEEKVQGASVDPNIDDDSDAVIIAVVVSLIIVLILVVVGIVLFLRWRKRRQATAVQEIKPTKPRPYISGPLQLEQPHVLIEPKHDGLGSPGSGESTALVPHHEEESQYVNTSHVNTTHEAETSHPLLHSPTSSRSPDITRVEYSQTVPGCRVTPMVDSQSDQASEDTERRSTMTSGRGSNASNDLLDWTLMDPDLLQHCRTTTPVLRNNQYWL